jgi:KipI family sensor histidine kinase inhibitor
LVELAGPAQVIAMWRAMGARPAAVEDVVPGAASILVRFAPGDRPTAGEISGWLSSLDPDGDAAAVSPADGAVTHVLPVVYDGDDIDEVSRRCGLSSAEVVRRHSSRTYSVAFLGFSPGFAYLAGGDPALIVSRLDSPRRRVPAGSVALADDMCAVYPSATPGGWRLLGHTDAVLFDPNRRPPALLRPGDQVRFQPVDRLGPRPPGRPAGRIRPGPDVAVEDPTAARPGRGPDGWGLEVVTPGPFTTVQDLGRAGWAHLGVPRGGAADRASLVLANRALGNPDNSATLEMTGAGPTLRWSVAGVMAVTGATGPLRLDGRAIRPGVPVSFGAGSVLEVGAFERGLRAYLALAGGIQGDPVLGSLSLDTLSGLGPPPLVTGDQLAFGSMGMPTAWSPPAPHDRVEVVPTPLPPDQGAVTVTAHPGPRREWMAEVDLLFRPRWSVGVHSDRAGLRLEGPPLGWSRPDEVKPEGMVAGALQLPPGGTPIVLLANHGPTGGYPVVAVIDGPDVDRLAQCRPGQEIRLVPGPGW